MIKHRFFSLRWRLLALLLPMLFGYAVLTQQVVDFALSEQQQVQHQQLAQQIQQRLLDTQRALELQLTQSLLGLSEEDIPADANLAGWKQLALTLHVDQLQWQSPGQPLASTAIQWPEALTTLTPGQWLWQDYEGSYWSCVRPRTPFPKLHSACMQRTASDFQRVLPSDFQLSWQLDAPLTSDFSLSWPAQETAQSGFWVLQRLPQSLLEDRQLIQRKIYTLLILAIFVLVLLTVIYSRSIIKPLTALQRYAKSIGRGESIKLHDKFRFDEVGQLYQSMYAMKYTLAERFQVLEQQAMHDGLTGLFNRFAATQQLETWGLTQSLFLLQLRIDGFKDINDNLGFACGDELLVQLARRLKELPHKPMLAARLDSVEFLLAYASPLTHAEFAQLSAQISQDYTLVQSKLDLRFICGSHQVPAQANLADYLRQLSMATQEAQRTRQLIVAYHAQLDVAHERQLTILRDLPVSTASADFIVTYQPVVRLRDSHCLGAEALIRWQHPSLGLISPSEFIPIAEYAGAMHVITQWMLNTVSADMAKWHKQGITLKVGVNLSMHDVLDRDLVGRIRHSLEQYHVDPTQLVLEVREEAVMAMPERALEILGELRQLGGLLTLDNFGTGQSSLAFLKTLPVQQLKLDRHFISSLVTGDVDRLIVKTSIDLAHAMGQIVIAEGVEDQATADVLRSMHCDLAQGFHYAKPMKAQEFMRWLTEHSAVTPAKTLS